MPTQYVIPPNKKIFDPYKIPPQKNTEDNFYEVQTTKCNKTMYQTATIRPIQFLIQARLQLNTIENTIRDSGNR